MTKADIIGELYSNEKFNQSLSKMCKNEQHIEDLKQEVMLILLEKDDKTIINMYNNGFLLFYTIGIIRNQYHSNTSDFWKKFRYDDLEIIDEITNEFDDIDYDVILTQHIEKYLYDIHWFDAHIFTMYYFKKIDTKTGKILKPLSYRKIQDLHTWHGMKIDYNKVAIVVKRTMELIKTKLEQDGYIQLIDGKWHINRENLLNSLVDC